MQRVKNISRIEKCRIQQTLRFKYDDVDKLPKVLDDILEEIKASCPDLITDGSRPLRAVWTEYREDHLRVVVTTNHNCKPIGQKFWETTQEVLMAINRAVKKNDVKFVTTSAE
jgi:small-conductance mechanosensitive channel